MDLNEIVRDLSERLRAVEERLHAEDETRAEAVERERRQELRDWVASKRPRHPLDQDVPAITYGRFTWRSM